MSCAVRQNVQVLRLLLLWLYGLRVTCFPPEGTPASVAMSVATTPCHIFHLHKDKMRQRTGGVWHKRKLLFSDADKNLWRASSEGDLDAVQAALMAGADVEVRMGAFNDTPLIIASVNGHNVVVEELLNTGADVNAVDSNGVSALFGASHNNHLETVITLLAAGAEIDQARDSDGITPLSIASREGHLRVVKALIDAGADLDKESESGGATALTSAAQEGHTEVVQTLLDAGADVDKERTSHNDTALFIASHFGYLDVVRVLLEAGADVENTDGDGSTPLAVASQDGWMDIVKALLEAGAGPNHSNNAGTTPLIAASQHSEASIVTVLIESGADPMQADAEGTTPLHVASVRLGDSSRQIATALVTAGAEVDARRSDGETPLIWAAVFGNVDNFQILLHAGADPSIPNDSGSTVLDLICNCLEHAAVPGSFPCPQAGCDMYMTQELIRSLLAP